MLTVEVLLAGREDVKCRLRALQVYSVNGTHRLIAPFQHHFVGSSTRLASVFTKRATLRLCIAVVEFCLFTTIAQLTRLKRNVTQGIALTDL